MSKASTHVRSFFVLAALTTMASGCAKATQSPLLPESSSIAPARLHGASAVETVIYSFGGGSGSTRDGATPGGGLLNVNGTLYGTTYDDGEHDFGTAFSVTLHGPETVLHNFGVAGDSGKPLANLIDVRGTPFGTTPFDGAYGGGTVYSLTSF